MHLAEFNIGQLKYDWDDPRVADFQNNLDRIYALAARSAGYVWHLPNDEMEAAQLGPLGGDPRMASTLSVWETAEDLWNFTFHTVHSQFYDRRDEWYDAAAQPKTRLVMWLVPDGHRPSIAEAMDRLQSLQMRGPTADAFGWSWVRSNDLHKAAK